MINMQELRSEAKAIRAEIVGIKARAETENRDCSEHENKTINAKAGRLFVLEENINAERNDPRRSLARTFREMGPGAFMSGGTLPPGAGTSINPITHTAEYTHAFHSWVVSKGTITPDALHAGADGTGGFVLPGSERLTGGSNIPRASASLDEGTPGSGGYPGRNTIDQRFIHQLTKRLAIIEVFAQELFELGRIHAFCGSPFYTCPSLFSSRRRECQREIILASLGDIEGEQPMSLTARSRLHEPLDLSQRIGLICSLGTVPICRQIIPLKWRKFPLKPCPEAEQGQAWKECQDQRHPPRKCKPNAGEFHYGLSVDLGLFRRRLSAM